MRNHRAGPIPEVVECPSCGRMIKPWRSQFMVHSIDPGGPPCAMSRQQITDEAVANTVRVMRAQKVLYWAHMIRDEDPAWVHQWIAVTDRGELEKLLATALAAIPAGATREKAFGWVQMLGA